MNLKCIMTYLTMFLNEILLKTDIFENYFHIRNYN